ncbi:hypothetical protein CUMW_235750 [Citrus unshiu]|nr:hypothetical protein CUMW_235750 [Citrus unshiu]
MHGSQCLGVSIHMQAGEFNSESRAWLLLAPSEWKVNYRWCETNPLDFLSCPIVSTAITSTPMKSNGDSVTVLHTRIEGGAKAVLTSGDLVLQRVRVIYARTYLYFWFDVDHQ